FCEGPHNMKDQLASSRGRVDRLCEGLEAHPPCAEGMHQADQVWHRPSEPIQPPDHQHVAWRECRQRRIQPGTPHLGTRDALVMENLRTAGRGEGVTLEVELLVVRRHVCIPDVHAWPRPYGALALLCHFATAFCNTHHPRKSRPSLRQAPCG